MPISLTSVTCKIIEHIIYSQLINHLDSNGILTDKQFGFRKRRSSETQLLITVQDLAQVPKGSAPIFFCYLPTCVSSDIRLFADDCLLYRTKTSQHDAVILQKDLNMLQQWEAKWLMSYNPEKFEVGLLRVTNKRKHIIHTHYKIQGRIIDTVYNTTYLGVTIQSETHNITKKTNNVSSKGVLTEKPLQLPPSRQRTSL